ncbi:hypothetical protein ACFRQM_47240, partial [Streptomyces sp. NPDC056831]|uniref:hypothetical protein n=1 Tax=Streptomyces sp. NPDC056831 TaxID=3345954 RepID=UPI0036B19D58
QQSCPNLTGKRTSDYELSSERAFTLVYSEKRPSSLTRFAVVRAACEFHNLAPLGACHPFHSLLPLEVRLV